MASFDHNLAEIFDKDKAYPSGQILINEGKLYFAKEDITGGHYFNPDKFQQIYLADLLRGHLNSNLVRSFEKNNQEMERFYVSGETKSLNLVVGKYYLLQLTAAENTTGISDINNIITVFGSDVVQKTIASAFWGGTHVALVLLKVSKQSYTLTANTGVAFAYTKLI